MATDVQNPQVKQNFYSIFLSEITLMFLIIMKSVICKAT